MATNSLRDGGLFSSPCIWAGSVVLSRTHVARCPAMVPSIRVKPLWTLQVSSVSADTTEGLQSRLYRAGERLSQVLPEFLTHKIMRDNKRAFLLSH